MSANFGTTFQTFFAESEYTCFVEGECLGGLLVSESITLGENSCLNFCLQVYQFYAKHFCRRQFNLTLFEKSMSLCDKSA